MQKSISFIKSQRAFCIAVAKKMCAIIKEKQNYMILCLNQYCDGNMSIEDYIKQLNAYNLARLEYRYWNSRAFYHNWEVLNYGS